MRARPDLLARLESARAETSQGLHSGASSSLGTRKRTRTSPTKVDRDGKRRREDETTEESQGRATDVGSRPDNDYTEGPASREEGRTPKRPGRPVKEEIEIGAVVILPHGTMDLSKRIKKPTYDDITSLVNQSLAICARHRGDLTINKTWSSDQGLGWIATLFPDLTALLQRRLPDENNYGLIPLAASGQTLKVVSGFEGAAFAERTGGMKSAWEKKILCFITKYKLQQIDITILDPPVFPYLADGSVQDAPVAGPSGLGSSSSEPQASMLRRSSRLMGPSTDNAISVHGSDSEEGPTAEEPLAPASPAKVPLSQGSSFIFIDPLAEFL